MADSNGIVVMEKPADISFKDVSAVLQKAHAQHEQKGIYMRVPHLPPEELEKWVGAEGKCFVAMDGDKLVGTGSVMVRKLNRWYWKGKAAELTMLGVLPEYQGMHISTMIGKAREQFIKERGFQAIYFDTAAENTRRLQIAEKDGYVMVDYLFPNINSKGHYFVGMMKWSGGCPFSKKYCAFRFNMKRIRVRAVYKVLGDKLYQLRGLVKG